MAAQVLGKEIEMDCRASRDGNAVVVEVEGRIDGATAGDLESSMMAEIEETDKVVVCDLSGVSYVSSAGLRAILVVAKRLSKQAVEFSICGLNGPVAEVFHISGFDRIFKVYEKREEALAEATADSGQA